MERRRLMELGREEGGGRDVEEGGKPRNVLTTQFAASGQHIRYIRLRGKDANEIASASIPFDEGANLAITASLYGPFTNCKK